MNKTLRILYVYGGILSYGGMEAYMMNYFRNIDKDKIQIDFMLHGKESGVYDEEILKSGSEIYNITPRGRRIKRYFKEIFSIISNGNYDIVHCHMDALNIIPLAIAKRCKVPVRISHSHNTAHLTNNFLKKCMLDILKYNIKKYATELWACSKLAGDWLYGSTSCYQVIPNAITFEKFKYSSEIKNRLKKELAIKNEFIVGHIGRFDYQKNHEYLIDIFNEYWNINKNSKLLLIGDGPLKKEIIKKVKHKQLEEQVIFLSSRDDANLYYNVMGCFVLPSFFEGLPLVLIEAQTNGLPCIVSDKVTSEAQIFTSGIRYVGLNEDTKIWSQYIEKTPDRNVIDYSDLVDSGYEILNASKHLTEMYLSLAK